MTRPTRRSPIRLLSASRNSSLKASRSLNRIAGPSLGAGRSFAATDHRAIGERIPRDLKSSVDWVDEDWAVAAVGERVGPRPGCGERVKSQRKSTTSIAATPPASIASRNSERLGEGEGMVAPETKPLGIGRDSAPAVAPVPETERIRLNAPRAEAEAALPCFARDSSEARTACPARGVGAALALPFADTETTHPHLDEISRHVVEGAHAVLLLARAGWHTTTNLDVPSNITRSSCHPARRS
jgi:hypothetical protein